MKKYLFIAATAIVALASCSDESFVGSNSPNVNDQDGTQAIVFNSDAKTITRADHVGADGADLLGKKFIVEGFKGDGSTMSEVFNNYYVSWTENTAGKTESNTSDWEYVGATAAAPSTLPSGAVQSIKYWDYSASQYDFAAYSTGKLAAENIKTAEPDGGLSAGQVLISTITKADTYAGPTYTLKGDVTSLKECYISDMVTAYKTNGSSSDYNKEVQLSFRKLASKVRVAFYETVPGYSVKDVEFYQDDATTAINADIHTNTSATLIGTFNNKGTYTISFPTIGTTNKNETDYNKAHVAFTAETSGTSATATYGTLNYGGAELKEAAGSYLGRNSHDATFAGTAGVNYYTDVLPNETSGALELRINYKLVSTDGSGEVITIHGAKAFIPAVYATWKPNYAYTYIFKIGDRTNGWTSTVTDDPAGLYPITFDAVVVDAEEHTQSTITTVATPSITTYQKGHVYNVDTTDPYVDEYDHSKGDIYLMVHDGTDLKHDLNAQAQLYEVTGSTPISEATVMDAMNIYTVSEGNIVGRNGLTLKPVTTTLVTEIAAEDAVDGNAIPVTLVKELTAEPSGWPSGYYKDAACTEDAPGTFAAGTYYQKYTAAKFTPEAKIYAYTYLVSDDTDTYLYSAEALTTEPSDWSTANLWYKDPNGVTKISDGTTTTTFEAGTYYKKYTNDNKIFAVKVIRVQ